MPDLEPAKTLAEALVQLQAQLPRVAKTADAQYGKYADLTMVSEALLPLMASLGLAFTARPTLAGEHFILLYSLTHVSGDEISGEYPLPAQGSPQQIGSAITYARRYALCAVTGLAPGGDDDDGHAGQQGHAEGLRQPVSAQDKARAKTSHLKAGTSRMARAQEEDPWAQDRPVDGQRAAELRADLEAEDKPYSSIPPQWQQLAILYGQLGITERETRLAEMTDRCGREITSAKDLSYAEAESAIRSLRELAAKEGAKSDA
jgi:hypothetical protein